MLSAEYIKILVNNLTVSNEETLAEKFGEVFAIILPKIIQREIEKRFKNGEPHKTLPQKNK